MIYKTFDDMKISALGFGAMRMPVIDGDDANLDESAVNEMVAYAMDHGINYYDTAWGYHGGNSETVLANALASYDRSSYFLATKFPGYDLFNMDKVEEIVELQLKKCGVEYFDFYLLHNVCEMNIGGYLDESNGILPYLLKQKQNGRIRHLGFSTHGSLNTMKQFLSVYGDEMEFAQIQLNYIDWSFQDAKSKMDLLKEYNIPVWVMEPLRGGKLAHLSEDDTAMLKTLRPNETIPAWSFRYIQTFPDVVVALSGMSNMGQLKENIETYETDVPLNEKELESLYGIAENMVKEIALPCTTCRYCISHCPQRLDIPMLLNLYNEHFFTDGGFIAPMAMMAIPEDKQPSACIACGVCESVCPQQIEISDAMINFAAKLANRI